MSSQNLFGMIPYYTSNYSNWRVFTERLDQYFTANNIDVSVHGALLLTNIGEDVYCTFRDLCYPKLPKEIEYNELIDIMQKHIDAKTSIVRERILFHKAEQEEQETITEWVERIKKLSQNCNYYSHLDYYLLEKFICGLRSGVIFDRLCEKQHEGLTLKLAIEIAVSTEKAINEK